MQLTISGGTCGWAPLKNSRNSAAKAPEISKELSIAETISQILNRSSYQVEINKQNQIILSHDNSPILSITTEQRPILTLIPENNLELIFQQFRDNCYIFINDQTNIEILICNSGQIIFQQNETNIQETFIPQNISQLLQMQKFYFKFTDIYKLLHSRFVKNGLWNNTLKTNERVHPKCCFFNFEDNHQSIEFILKITYEPIEKKYKYFIVRPRFEENTWELQKNQNEYFTNKQINHEYKINLATKQIFKINTSVNVNENGTFELKWSRTNLYHWKDVDNKSQLHISQLSVEEEAQAENLWNSPGSAAQNFSSFGLKALEHKNNNIFKNINIQSIESVLNNNGNQKSIYDRIKKILQSKYTINSSKLIEQINLNFENTGVLSLTSELVLTILCHQFIEFTYYKFENSFYKFKNTKTNEEIWINNNNGNIVYIKNSSDQSTYDNSNIINILNICPLH
jgi:hypothetical protein